MSRWWIDETVFIGRTDLDAFKTSGWNVNHIVRFSSSIVNLYFLDRR